MTFSELTEVLTEYGFLVEEKDGLILVSRRGRVVRIRELIKIPLSEFQLLVSQVGDLL